MVTVKFVDSSNPDKVLLANISLPFEPRAGIPIRVWDYFTDRKKRLFEKRRERCFIVDDVYQYEISTEEPERSGIVYLAREVKP